MSEDRLERPRSPESWLAMDSMSEADFLSFLARNGMSAGSKSPERVPIMAPSSGVKPIEVSTDFPLRTAVMLTPFPM